MSTLLIVYGSSEGQTRKIAQYVAGVARELGHRAQVEDSAALPAGIDPGWYDGVVIAGSLHAGKHQPALRDFVRAHARALSRLPTALFSVRLSATGSDLPGARRCAQALLDETGWTPGLLSLTAGALKYSRYGWLTRWMMRRIARRAGGDTDTRRDYEYTVWGRLRSEVESFLLDQVAVQARYPDNALAEAAG